MTRPSYVVHALSSIAATGYAIWMVFEHPELAAVPLGVATVNALSLLERDREAAEDAGRQRGFIEGYTSRERDHEEADDVQVPGTRRAMLRRGAAPHGDREDADGGRSALPTRSR